MSDGSNGSDVLQQSGIVRSDITTSFGSQTETAEAVPITLELTVLDLAGGDAVSLPVGVHIRTAPIHRWRDGGGAPPPGLPGGSVMGGRRR